MLEKRLDVSLEQKVEGFATSIRRSSCAREAVSKVKRSLRRVAFDEYPRDECWLSVPLLQFCAQRPAESRALTEPSAIDMNWTTSRQLLRYLQMG